MATVLLCLCGCPKLSHKMGRKECLKCGACSFFELDGEVPTSTVQPTEGVVAAAQAAAEELPTVGQWPGGEPGDTLSTSTSARLARAEAERDAVGVKLVEALAKARDAEHSRKVAAERHRIEWGLERDASVKLRRARDDARAELASAQQELKQLRAALGNTAAAYVATTTATAADVIYAYDAWSCLTEGGCGSRYTMPAAALEHRCGPLTPVRVSIMRRSE